jgi:hypothetical protein
MSKLIPYRVIRTDGSETSGIFRDADSGDTGKHYEALKTIILDVIGHDNDLEHVNVFWEGRYCDMFVDETGLLKNLPINARATEIYRNNMLVHAPGLIPIEDMAFVYGDVVLFTERVWT